WPPPEPTTSLTGEGSASCPAPSASRREATLALPATRCRCITAAGGRASVRPAASAIEAMASTPSSRRIADPCCFSPGVQSLSWVCMPVLLPGPGTGLYCRRPRLLPAIGEGEDFGAGAVAPSGIQG